MGEYYNTIILRHAEGSYTKKQFKNYSEGDCIYGPNTDPEELKRWTYDQLNEAKETKKCPMGWDQSCYSCMHCFPGHYERPDDYKGKDVCVECKR